MTERIHTLREVARHELRALLQFNFRYTFWKPSHFRTGLEVHRVGTSWRSFMCGETAIGVRFDFDGSKVLVRVFSDRDLTFDEDASLRSRIVYSYGLDEDISNFLSLAASRDATADAARLLCGMRMSCPESIFEISVLGVLLQNTTVARTEQMLERMLSAYGGVLEFDGIRLRCFFPAARLAKATPDELRECCKLGYRAPTISAIAHHFARRPESAWGHITQGSTNDQFLREELVKVRGIGPFTANVIASHALRKASEPALDAWNTPIAARHLGMTEQASRSDVQSRLMREYPGWAALALLYMVEAEYATHPVVPLMT